MYKIKVNEHGSIIMQYRSPEVEPVHGTETDDGGVWLERSSPLEVGTQWWTGTDWAIRADAPNKWDLWVSGAWVENATVKNNIQGQAMVTVRSKRNSLLGACDWTQVSDAPITDSKRAEWVTYRAALRDIPTTVVTSESLVTWPTVPS